MKFYLNILLIPFIFFSLNAFSYYETIVNYRYFNYSEKIRIVFDLSNKIDYKVANNSNEIILDIKNIKLEKINKSLNNLDLNEIYVTVKKNNDNLKLIFKSKFQFTVKHFLLKNPNRLVIDIYKIKKNNHINIYKEENEIIKNNLTSDISNKIKIIIDPGHGGHDSGAIGYSGTKEKDITLSVAKHLKEILTTQYGFTVILTRDSDFFIPLRNRLFIAHKHNANLFISIHADAYHNTDACGASIFALSPSGATSEAARWLAEKENASELGQVLLDKSILLRSVLIDLAQTATISVSLDIGKKIIQYLESVAKLHFRKVEQAAFVVLKSPYIPSLLVEVGFISNENEEIKLINPIYQEQIAMKLANGINSYFITKK